MELCFTRKYSEYWTLHVQYEKVIITLHEEREKSRDDILDLAYHWC